MRTKAHFFPDLNMSSILEPADPSDSNFADTKVIVTVGPSCHSVEVLSQLLEAGMSTARFDLTWGPLDYHKESLDNLQAAMRKTRKLCATMIDTLGREVMIRRPYYLGDDGYPWQVGNEIAVQTGQLLTLTIRTDVEASDKILPVTYTEFAKMVELGDLVYIGRYLVCGADQASLYLEVVEITETDVICEAKNDSVLDGLLTVFHVERSSDLLLNVQNDLPLLSDYDKACLTALTQEYEIDFISLSYTRTDEDVLEAKDFLNSIGMRSTKVFAKVESRMALMNFKGVLAAADGVIISRGNLGLDCEPEKMAMIQKTLIQSCNIVGKPAVLTRVVDTMSNTPRPTRAEATDVANAVLDGVDAIMLGAETLRGQYPLDSVRIIISISRQAEKVFDHIYHFDHLMESAMEVEESVTPAGMSPYMSSEDLDSSGKLSAKSTSEDGTHDKRKGVKPSKSYASLTMAIKAMTHYGPGSQANLPEMDPAGPAPSPYLSKMESIASCAVRAADKVKASLIVVYTHSGKTASLVAKYRPAMPILTLVIPKLVSNALQWKLEGRHSARQCLCTRGLLPVLAAPRGSGEAVLDEAVMLASKMGLAKSHSRIVVVQRIHDEFCVKILSLDEDGGPKAFAAT